MKSILIAIVLALVVGCAGFAPVIQPETPKEAYLVALTEYNNLLELYAKNLPLLKDEALRIEASKLFWDASRLLDVWLIALNADTGVYEGQIKASKVLSELTTIIIRVLEEVAE